MTTLRELHKELNITQRLSLYVKNQNKKYKLDKPLTADEELPKTLETLITINTLGKQRNHNAQAKYLHDMTGNYGMAMIKYREKNEKLSNVISEKVALEYKLKAAEEKAQRAEKIVNNANMRDYIIELLQIANDFDSPDVYEVSEKMEHTARKYVKAGYDYIGRHNLSEILKNEANKLIDYLKQKEGK